MDLQTKLHNACSNVAARVRPLENRLEPPRAHKPLFGYQSGLGRSAGVVGGRDGDEHWALRRTDHLGRRMRTTRRLRRHEPPPPPNNPIRRSAPECAPASRSRRGRVRSSHPLWISFLRRIRRRDGRADVAAVRGHALDQCHDDGDAADGKSEHQRRIAEHL